MDVILKVTSACNYRCTFCSSTGIQHEDDADLDLAAVRRFFVRFPKTRTVIINGGDPLMTRPSYYWKLIEMLDELGMADTSISFTTNLWAFYKKPELWQDLFRHPRVGVATSFQYGNARLKGDLTPFTEAEFWEISNLFLDRVGYRPSFIAVITPENEHTALDTVRLARAMDVVCKVNYAVASGPKKTVFKGIKVAVMGNEDTTYVLADIYERYLQIHDAGLAPWEHNTQQLMVRLQGLNTTCPQNRSCDQGIRTLQPGEKYYSCGSFGDDGLYPIDFDQEMAGDLVQPLRFQSELQSLKNACYTCPLFEICNGCRKTIHDLKNLNLVETHCSKMKGLAPQIIRLSGLEGRVAPTPYVREYNE